MTTQVYRVARVLTAVSSPVARLHAVDAQGHELRLEVPATAARDIAAGHVLVLEWSAHAMPEVMAQDDADFVQQDEPNISTGPAPSGSSVDEAFMDLMGQGRRGASGPNQSRAPFTAPLSSPWQAQAHDINDEFNTLLGSTRTKG